MRKIKLIIAFATISISLSAKNKEEIVNSSIQNVTVFLQGAQVKRSGNFSIKKGITNLVIENVSPYLDQNSIQANGKGDYIILNVQKDLKYPDPETFKNNNLNAPHLKRIKLTQDSLSDLQFEIELANQQLSSLELEKELIKNHKLLTGESKSDSLELLKNAMIYLRNKLQDINIEIHKVKKKQKELTEINIHLNSRLAKLRNYSNNAPSVNTGPIHRVLVTVQAEKDTYGKINVEYYVTEAGWVPAYDIHAKNTTSPIEITHKAQVYQNTGETWNDVLLTFSSYTPNRDTKKPGLPVWYLNYYQQEQRNEMNINPQEKLLNSRISSMAKNTTTFLGFTDNAPEEQLMDGLSDAENSAYYSQIVNTRTNVEFKMSLPYSIESGSGSHFMAISKSEVDVDYYHYLVPKMEREAFLLANIPNWEELNLLPASANIYFEETFVGKAMINPQILTDTLELALGRDRSVICERKKITDENKNSILGPHKIKTAEFEFIVRNNRDIDIQNIIIEDQIPVSTNQDIEVEIIDKDKAKYNQDTGYLTWNLKLKGKEKKNFHMSYSIKYDKNKLLSNL